MFHIWKHKLNKLQSQINSNHIIFYKDWESFKKFSVGYNKYNEYLLLLWFSRDVQDKKPYELVLYFMKLSNDSIIKNTINYNFNEESEILQFLQEKFNNLLELWKPLIENMSSSINSNDKIKYNSLEFNSNLVEEDRF